MDFAAYFLLTSGHSGLLEIQVGKCWMLNNTMLSKLENLSAYKLTIESNSDVFALQGDCACCSFGIALIERNFLYLITNCVYKEKEVHTMKSMITKNTLVLVGCLFVHFSFINSLLADDKRGFSVKDVKGNYSFSFDGEIVGIGPLAATGAFQADGKGNVTEAVRTISFLGDARTETFSCTLEVNANGTGKANCPLDNPAPGAPAVETFDFVLEDNAKSFRMVGTTPGIVVLGGGSKR